MTVNNLDLPQDGRPPVDVRKFDRNVRKVLSDPKRYMYKPGFREQARAPPSIKAYDDPILRDPQARLELAVRLWKCNMFRTVRECLSAVSLFSVVKSVAEDGTVHLRLVFDFRGINDLFVQPPWAALGGPSALASVDVSEELEQGWHLEGAAGDVPAFF